MTWTRSLDRTGSRPRGDSVGQRNQWSLSEPGADQRIDPGLRSKFKVNVFIDCEGSGSVLRNRPDQCESVLTRR